MIRDVWYSGVVVSGTKTGRKIGFPTVNLNPQILGSKIICGVYECWVRYGSKEYLGAMYFGPRLVLCEKNIVLEIHILGFNKDIYNKKIKFRIGRLIRPPRNFNNIEDLIGQIQKDLNNLKTKPTCLAS